MKVIVVEVHHTDRPESAWKNAPDGDRLIKRNGAKNEGEYVSNPAALMRRRGEATN